jgi:hypothetical protein
VQYESFIRLVRTLTEHGVRFVMIGVGAANLYARTGAEVFSTKDRDLFLPLDPRNLLQAWQLSVEAGCDLWTDDEPLGKPLDLPLAEAVVFRRALTTATHSDGLTVDLTLTMAGFDFETIWKEHGQFNVGNVEIPVARLAHIVESKARANRPKDRLFLETYRERLRDLLDEEE